MINAIKGNIFDSKVQVIAHQVNCKGVMGAGIAKQIANRYPDVYNEYRNYCKVNKTLLGDCLLVKTKDGRYIANLFGQAGYSRRELMTNYSALRKSFESLRYIMGVKDLKTLAIPYKIGCGLAGGDWNIVYNIIDTTFYNLSIDIEIWKLN